MNKFYTTHLNDTLYNYLKPLAKKLIIKEKKIIKKNNWGIQKIYLNKNIVEDQWLYGWPFNAFFASVYKMCQKSN